MLKMFADFRFLKDGFVVEVAAVGEEEKHYAACDKGKAEPLPHVEGHAAFKVHLLFFDEFDEEAHSEEGYEPPSEEDAGTQLAILLAVDKETDQEDNEIGDRLIELGWMFRHHLVVTLEDDTPRQGGLNAVDFAVEEVAKADEGSAKGNGNDRTIHHPDGVDTIFAVEEPDGNGHAHCGAMAREALIARKMPPCGIMAEGQYHLQEMLLAEVVARLVEDAMPQTRPYQHGEEDIDHKGVEELGVDLLAFEHRQLDKVPKQESTKETQRIPSQSERAYVEDDRVDVPVDEIDHSRCIIWRNSQHGFRG